MPIFSCAAVLFDLDGVLVDSTRSVDREWREWAARKGVDGDAIMAIAHGVRTVEVIRTVAPHLDAEAEAWEIENREAGSQEGVVVMPGALELVRSIPSGRWGVVTSGSRPLATARLQYCGLPVPEVLVTSDDVTQGKPHPEPYLKGSAGLGFPPAECLVIEDAPAGIQSARAGGMKVIGLASTYAPAKLSQADAIIRGFQELSVREVGERLIVTAASSARNAHLIFRCAGADDRASMVVLINSAFAIEKFLEGNRTNESELAERMRKGKFLLGHDESGTLIAVVYVELRGSRGYFGMLAVDPKRQGNGIGRKMVEAAEEYCREKGCTAMDLTVLSLRPELPPLYRKLGYVENGTEEFRPSRPLKDSLQCHCIVMSKAL
ncbi:MAG TPA: HAD-IA family hydrolase [Candidatus Sulfotelmatobacter sp.]|nr:HAD-IA family hydrolase [Candidatus Sulfotelmatobacter sp.]